MTRAPLTPFGEHAMKALELVEKAGATTQAERAAQRDRGLELLLADKLGDRNRHWTALVLPALSDQQLRDLIERARVELARRRADRPKKAPHRGLVDEGKKRFAQVIHRALIANGLLAGEADRLVGAFLNVDTRQVERYRRQEAPKK